jgi:hypothetical protein
MSIECDHEIPLPPLPKMMPSTISGHHHNNNTDFDGLSEKYWGEILERTFSSNSIHALQHHQPLQQQRHHPQHNHHHTQVHHNGKFHHPFSDINLNRSDTNLYYSNSEPRLCELDLHDINCAKNKAFFGEFNRIGDI